MPELEPMEEQVVRRMTEIGPLVERRRLAEIEGINPAFASSLRERLLQEHPRADRGSRLRYLVPVLIPIAAALAVGLFLRLPFQGTSPAARNVAAPASTTVPAFGPANVDGADRSAQRNQSKAAGPSYAESIPSSPAILPVTRDAASVTARSHGIRLTIRVPRRAYPRNALVRVTVRAVNISRHTVFVIPTPQYGLCPSLEPEVRVESRDGHRMYSPSAFGPDFYTCRLQRAPPVKRMVQAGRAIDITQYIVLRGPRLQATVDILEGRRSVTVITPPLDPPRTTMQPVKATVHGGRRPYAVVTPPAHADGTMLAAMTWRCRSTKSRNSGTESGAVQFSPANPRHLTPTMPSSCAAVLEWHAAVGWENHPIAVINYRRPG